MIDKNGIATMTRGFSGSMKRATAARSISPGLCRPATEVYRGQPSRPSC